MNVWWIWLSFGQKYFIWKILISHIQNMTFSVCSLLLPLITLKCVLILIIWLWSIYLNFNRIIFLVLAFIINNFRYLKSIWWYFVCVFFLLFYTCECIVRLNIIIRLILIKTWDKVKVNFLFIIITFILMMNLINIKYFWRFTMNDKMQI